MKRSICPFSDEFTVGRNGQSKTTLHRELSEEQSLCFQPEGFPEALRATRQTEGLISSPQITRK
jgi:hypothetical protein